MKDNTVIPVQVTDVSPNGAGVSSEVDPCLSVGDIAKLKVRGHAIEGKVMRLVPADPGFHLGLKLSTSDGMLLS